VIQVSFSRIVTALQEICHIATDTFSDCKKKRWYRLNIATEISSWCYYRVKEKKAQKFS